MHWPPGAGDPRDATASKFIELLKKQIHAGVKEKKKEPGAHFTKKVQLIYS